MRELETIISPFIEKQFPSFYVEEGPLFILFAKEYFKWLETESAVVDGNNVAGQTIFHSKKLLSYRDIDATVDEFLVHFKNKYLVGVDFDTIANKRTLVKAARDLFQSKGTERSFDLLFRLVFGTKIEVYYPGDDILKPSDGTWVVPKYIELSRSTKTPGLVGKQVRGSKSGATAFVEYLITRNIKGNIIDVAYLSNLEGHFQTGDIITNDGIIDKSPKVVGSLTSIDITTNGGGFVVGEIVNIVSARGIEGKARVTSIISETGKVSFAIIDGGWGYSNTADTYVSGKVLKYTGLTNANSAITGFERSETITQTLYNLVCNNVTGDILTGELLINGNSNTATIAHVVHLPGSNTASIYANPVSGDITSNSIVYAANQALIATNNNIVFAVGQAVTQYSGGSSTGAVGKVESVSNCVILTINPTPSISANGLHVGTYVIQATTDARGFIKAVNRESNFGFTNVTNIVLTSTTGTFNSTYALTTYTDSSATVPVSTATPNTATAGYLYALSNVNIASARWSSSNTVVLTGQLTTNNKVIVASDVGGKFISNVNISATGVLMGINAASRALGLRSVTSTFYTTGNTRIVGTSSNTYANVDFISTGSGASFGVGLIKDSETVLLSTDKMSANNDGPGSNSISYINMIINGVNSGYGNMSSVQVFSGGSGYSNTNIVRFSGGNTGVGSFGAANATIVTNPSGVITSVTLTANVGNSYVTTPTVSVVNSTGGSTGVGTGANLAPIFHLGFPKLPSGDPSYILRDILTYGTRTIGTISSLSAINPGENYNIDPFVAAYEPGIASLGKYDYVLELAKPKNSAALVLDENVEQVLTQSTITIESSSFSGNTSGQYEIGETVYQNNGSSNTAVGELLSSSGSSPITSVILVQSGTFTNTRPLLGATSKGTSTVSTVTSSTTTSKAKGVYRGWTLTGSNTTHNFYAANISRRSVFSDFISSPTNLLTGVTTGATAIIKGVTTTGTLPIGDNAIITGNVVTSTGSISSIAVADSGFGYVQDETANLVSEDGAKVATGKLNITNEGTGTGYYSSTRGFLDHNKYIHDGEYYQEFSYEVQSTIPLDNYSTILKQVVHVAGTRLFGKLVKTSSANLSTVVVSSNITVS